MQTDRIIPNNKQDIIIRDNVKGTCMLIDVAISGDKNVIKKEAEKDFKIQRPYKMNIAHLGCKNESDTSNDRGNLNHLKIIQKMPEQRTGKARNQGTEKTATLGPAHVLRKLLM